MASKLTLKNDINTEFSITHSDGELAKSINGKDIAVAVDTINDFPTVATDGDVVIVRDLDRGGTFIYDSAEVANSNNGTNFNGWVRQYSGNILPEWFGAKLDGVTDDTMAIYASIKSNITLDFRGKIGLVSGLSLSAVTNLNIINGGLKKKNATNLPILSVSNSDRFSISNFELDGNGNNQSNGTDRSQGSCILITNTTNYTIEECFVHDAYSGAGILVVDNGSTSTEIHTNGIIRNNRVINCGFGTGNYTSDGIYANSDNTIIEGNTIHNCTDYGITGDYSKNATIINNKIDSCLVGIGILGAFNWLVNGNSINNTNLGISVTLSGNTATSPYLSDTVRISGNSVRNTIRPISGSPSGDAISIDPSALRISIVDNLCDTAFRGIVCPSDNSIIANNTIRYTTDNGLFIDGNGCFIIANNTKDNVNGNYYNTLTNKIIVDDIHDSKTYITTFIGGWSNYGAPFENAGYLRMGNEVKLFGAVKAGTVSVGQPIFQLPVGLRPAYPIYLLAADFYNGIAQIGIDVDGNILYLNATTGSQVHLDQLSFIL